MAYKEEWPDRWGWGHGGGESERGAVGGAEGVASYGVTNPGRKSLSCGELAAENRRLYLDNMRLWDCLALFRTDPCLTCQGAINTIFTLDDNEYLREFPDTQQLLSTRFPGGLVHQHNELDALSENNRLREENTRLHASVWVLRDNPSLHADSTVAAIFRLNDAEFQRKFGVVNQVTSGLCYRNIFERSSRNNNKTKVKAMRTHLELGAKNNTIHLIKKPLGPRRLARAKSMSSNRQTSPLRESSVTASPTSRKRSESAEPLQNFSTNRKPASPGEMWDFLYSNKCYESSSLFGSDMPPFFAREKSRDCEKRKKPTRILKNKKLGGAMNSISDTRQPCSTNLTGFGEIWPGRRAPKPIKCVSFEEPLPSKASDMREESYRKYSLDNITNDKTSGKPKPFEDRLRAILYGPMDYYPSFFTENEDGKSQRESGMDEKAREKGRSSIRSRKPRHRSASLSGSPTRTDKAPCEMRRKRGCSEKSGTTQRGSRLQICDLRGSNSNRKGSGYLDDDDDDDEDDDEELEREDSTEDDNGSFRGPFYTLSGRCRRPGKIRIRSIHREPSKRHKQRIRLSPVLDPRASLHRLRVSAGDGSLLEIEPHCRDRTGHGALNKNCNKSESLDDISEDAVKGTRNLGRIVFSKESVACTTGNTRNKLSSTKSVRFSLNQSCDGQRNFDNGRGCVGADLSSNCNGPGSFDNGRGCVGAALSSNCDGPGNFDNRRGYVGAALSSNCDGQGRFDNGRECVIATKANKLVVGKGYFSRVKVMRRAPGADSSTQLYTCDQNYNAATKEILGEKTGKEIYISKKESTRSSKDIDHVDKGDNLKRNETKSKSKRQDDKTAAILNFKSGKKVGLPQVKSQLNSNLIYKKVSFKNRDTSAQASIKISTALSNEGKANKSEDAEHIKKVVSKSTSFRDSICTSGGSESCSIANTGPPWKIHKNSEVGDSNANLPNVSSLESDGFKSKNMATYQKQLNSEAFKIISGESNIGECRQENSKVKGNSTLNASSQRNQTNRPLRGILRESSWGKHLTNKVYSISSDVMENERGLSPTAGEVADDKNSNRTSSFGIPSKESMKTSKSSLQDKNTVTSGTVVSCKDTDVFTDQKQRVYRKSVSSVDAGASEDSVPELVTLSPAEDIIHFHQVRRRSQRPRSAGVREFISLRQENWMHSKARQHSESTFGQDSRQLMEAESKPFKTSKELSIMSANNAPDPILYKGFIQHSATRSGQVPSQGTLPERTALCPGPILSPMVASLSQPEVYLSTEPAPTRACRYKPYPHRSYVTVKQFTDRHQRLMPQPTPSLQRSTSTMFSFSRERSPSMALVLDDDYQRWMEKRVRASDLIVEGPESIPAWCLDQHHRKRFKHAYKRNLERWPKVVPPKHSIYEILDKFKPQRDGFSKVAKGSLKGCNTISYCVPNDVRLEMLKELGGVKYRKALAIMIKRNMQCPEKNPSCSTEISKTTSKGSSNVLKEV